MPFTELDRKQGIVSFGGFSYLFQSYVKGNNNKAMVMAETEKQEKKDRVVAVPVSHPPAALALTFPCKDFYSYTFVQL